MVDLDSVKFLDYFAKAFDYFAIVGLLTCLISFLGDAVTRLVLLERLLRLNEPAF